MSTSIYYTYAWLRVDGSPYYIGKGHGNRAYDRRRKFCPPRDRILILKRNLSESDAFKHEIYMIAVYGRKDLGTGILHNCTTGGEGATGAIRSAETKLLIAASKVGDRNVNWGKKWCVNVTTGEEKFLRDVPEGWELGRSDSFRKRMSQSRGPTSESHKNAIAQSLTGRTATAETKLKMSESHSGEKNHNFGKTWKWWVNSTGETKHSQESPGPEWQRGRKWRDQ
jgi:hypothetical protein